MNHFKKNISVLLIFAILQFFVPIFNVAAKLPCCDSSEMSCCQEEYPARMVCCIEDAEDVFKESEPIQARLSKNYTLPTLELVFWSPISSTNIVSDNFDNSFVKINPCNYSIFNNKLYKEISHYLI